MIGKYLNPRNDAAFKRIFGKEDNKEILIAMLNAVLKNQLHRPIKDVVFLQTIQDPDIAYAKQSVVDVLCKDKDGCQYIIEMQIAHRKGFEKRAQYYASKAFISQMKEGDKYHNLKEVIFLAFTNFNIFPNKKKYKSEHVTLDKDTGEQNLDLLSFTFVNLPKFKKQLKKDLSELSLEEKFYYFLEEAQEINPGDLKKLIGKDKVIMKAFHVIDCFNWTAEEKAWYEKVDKINKDHEAAIDYALEKAEERGIKKGKVAGIKEGKEESKKAIAKQMLANGMESSLIAELTGLDFKEIEEIL